MVLPESVLPIGKQLRFIVLENLDFRDAALINTIHVRSTLFDRSLSIRMNGPVPALKQTFLPPYASPSPAPPFGVNAKPIRGIRVIRGPSAPWFWNQVKALGYLCCLLLESSP